MSRPIKATPTLNAKQSKKFLKQVEEGLKNPTGPVPTPKINEAMRKIMEDVKEKDCCNKRDLVGKRFGRWLVLKGVERDERGYALWSCRCDCGTEKIVLEGNLKNGHTKSCGCFRIEKFIERVTTHGLSKTKEYHKKYNKKYHENLQSRDDPRRALMQIKNRAKRKGVLWKFTKSEWTQWYLEQKRTCEYCEILIGRVVNEQVPSGISIDRKNNNGPYSEENCCLACYECNRIKGNSLTYDEMMYVGQNFQKPKWQSTISGNFTLS